MKTFLTICLTLSFSQAALAQNCISKLKASSFEQMFLTVFPNVRDGAPTTLDENFEKLVKTVFLAKSVFSNLEISQSEAQILTGAEFNPMYEPKSKSLLIYGVNIPGRMLDPIPIMIHEYAHSIIEPNLAKHLEVAMTESAPNDLKRFTGKSDDIPASVRVLADPFHELMADTIAVLVLNDPKAIAKFMLAFDGTETRDFSADYPIDGWSGGELAGTFHSKGHDVFNPTRSAVWKLYLELRQTNDDAAAIVIGRLMQSSIRMIQQLYLDGTTYRQWSEYDKGKLNRQLLKILLETSR